MDSYKFPMQKSLYDNFPFTRDLLLSLLETAYSVKPPFTGYLKFTGDDCIHFLLFFNGTPYAASRFTDSKPVAYTIQELGRYLAKNADGFMSVSLCETDPVLMKSLLLFLQEEPAVKAPPSLIDFEHILRQIGEVGAHAMIALCCDKKTNFFFFKDGKGTLAYYADLAFKRPEGMTIDEEMLLYAFQPGAKVQAYIFRDMNTHMEEDSSQLDKDSLYRLLTVGYLQDRRKADREKSPMPDKNSDDRPKVELEISPGPAVAGDKDPVSPLRQKPKLPSVVLSVESGPLKGESFTVTLPCTIGRKDCDLVLDDRLISRRHAELKVVDHKLVIEDLASTNGTRVNDKTVTTKQLVPKDLISIGSTMLRVHRA
jgi:hypothetical protein